MLYDRALVVDRSSVARQLIDRFLRLHAKEIVRVATVEEARLRCAEGVLDAIVADRDAPGSLEWFENWEQGARPAFVFTTTEPSAAEETKVTMAGAIGYLAKPFTYRQLASALASTSPFYEPAPPRVRHVPLARASVVDRETGEQQIACEVRDLSTSGAFLAAAAPIATNTRLRLRFHLADQSVTVDARVVRLQEPRWGVTPGWGVAFEHDPETRDVIEGFVRQTLAQDQSY